jgi:hypothetical protein
MATKTMLKAALFAMAFAAAHAFAFYGTEIRDYRANPWLDHLGDASPARASPTAGATARPASEAKQPANAALERFFAEADRASQAGR